MNSRQKILCILHRSPPAHGAAQVGDMIAHSSKLHEEFDCKFITIKSSTSLSSIGGFAFIKIYYLLELYVRIFLALVALKPDKIYFTASNKSFAFYRDLILSTLWKMYSLFKKVDVFYHFHTKGVEDFVAGSVVKTALTKFFLKDVNLILLSPLLENDFLKVNTFKRVLYLPNGVGNQLTENQFDQVIKDKFSNNKPLNVLYLSNMIKSKGYFKVLELAKKIKEEPIQFNFAGGWTSQKDKNDFFQFIKDNNLSGKVFFHGFVSGNEKQELFKKAHFFIFPTRYKNEAFPLSILEALSFGVSVIATDEGSIPHMLDEQSGIIVNDVNKLKEALEEARKQLLNKGAAMYCRQRYLDNFSLEKFEDNLISVLKK
jgi:glycosyltransferase involved in cell wall biosynthesis